MYYVLSSLLAASLVLGTFGQANFNLLSGYGYSYLQNLGWPDIVSRQSLPIDFIQQHVVSSPIQIYRHLSQFWPHQGDTEKPTSVEPQERSTQNDDYERSRKKYPESFPPPIYTHSYY
ncbi:hypothetical protein PPYR_10419 [Photinus pyralis]|uniref:Uncharacterized protein n=1 Tax=Photinus pyralis TaxID=7054 RepID=A0A5N4AGM0_PHOPY|nr:uncharacterized protein LOC116174816 isoform X2 [Photinus pyralis]KAB0796358.1 hypothetical protein PPYR_10419 [Photinus pyralis]